MEKDMEKQSKCSLRKSLLKQRNEMSENERTVANLALADKIIGHQWFYQADVLLTYVNFGSEAATIEIMKEAFNKGKEVFVPKVSGNIMEFFKISGWEDLEVGYMGIMEPKTNLKLFSLEELKSENKKYLILVPGVGFDQYNNRIGYGKGFYDRFFAANRELITYSIGIGYKCQLVKEILDTREHDIKPYQVILV